MKEVERNDFDDYASNYQDMLDKHLQYFSVKLHKLYEYKIRIVQKLTTVRPGKILDYGCGVGSNIPYLQRFFPQSQIFGFDISEESLDIAKKNHPDAFYFNHDLSKCGESYDLILIANVFHHVPIRQRENLIRILKKSMSKNGEIFIFEHNPVNPVTRYIVERCPFDKNVLLLYPREVINFLNTAGFKINERRYILFFPPIFKSMFYIEQIFSMIPFGAQYLIKATNQ